MRTSKQHENPILIGPGERVFVEPGTPVITVAESLIRLAASLLDEAAVSSESDGGFEYVRRVGSAMGVTSHLMHGLILKELDRYEGVELYEAGFKEGIEAAENLVTVFTETR